MFAACEAVLFCHFLTAHFSQFQRNPPPFSLFLSLLLGFLQLTAAGWLQLAAAVCAGCNWLQLAAVGCGCLRFKLFGYCKLAAICSIG
jgi:hypothetical protein